MSIAFIVPYVPIPRMIKRINTACSVDNTSVIFWDRGTDESSNIELPINVRVEHVIQRANEGEPLRRLGATFKFCIKAFSFLKRENPTCIHVTKTDMLLLVLLYCLIKRKRPKVIYEVSDIHSMALNNSKSLSNIFLKKFIFVLERLGMSVVDNLIVTSESFWSTYYRKLIPRESVLFLPNTPRESIFKDYRAKRSGKFRIGFIGKVRYKEQLKLLIDASEKADIEVLIAGNGIDLNEIKEYSRGKKNVIVHGAYNYEKEIAALYSKIDCVYSMYDTKVLNVRIALPNRLYEAALCGLPLVVSRNTELSNLVEREQIGMSVSDGDVDELTKALLRLKGDSLLQKKMEKNCKAFYRKWQYETVNQKLIHVYDGLSKGS